MKKVHSSSISVYYEDTDSTGVVYHTNYLKYAERARINLIRDKFPEIQNLFNSNIFFFVISQLSATFLKPAKLSDILRIDTFFIENSYCSIKLRQKIFNNEKLLIEIVVKLVWIKGKTYKPAKIPENIIARFNSIEVV